MKLSDEKLITILRDVKIVSQNQLEEAQSIAQDKGLTLYDALLEGNFISDEHLGRLVAQNLGYKFIHLGKIVITDDILRIIPELTARNRRAVVFGRDRNGIRVAMSDPGDLETIGLIQKKTGEIVSPYYATESDIDGVINLYHRNLPQEFRDLLEKYSLQTGGAKTTSDLPIIQLLSSIIQYAYDNRASDIHIEPQREKLMIRFRIDGVLHDAFNLPKSLEEPFVSRIKVLSKLRIDEHRSAQDGKFRFAIIDTVYKNKKGEEFDIRVSVVPITEGEKVVMRLLSAKNRQLNLDNIGVYEQDLKIIKKAFQRPYGMIISSGPTGCGKTTTLYTILQKLNSRDINISTIEDPVEYDIGGANQIQVNEKTNLTFATGLRSILRQDPDVIMVGEIRDDETANIAVNAAMTGHLVLSTLHTNDAATALPRLLDMKIEPFLIASTVNVIVGQRLVRKICNQCIVSYSVSRKELVDELSEQLVSQQVGGSRKTIRLYKGKGCKICSNTGYHGRIGIFEVLKVTESIKKLIMSRADSDTIKSQAIKEGMTTMFDDGFKKVIGGITSLDEIIRVINQDTN